MTSVSGVVSGSLPTSATTLNNVSILKTRYQGSVDDTLYTVLPNDKISSVSLESSSVKIRKQITGSIERVDTLNRTVNIDGVDLILPEKIILNTKEVTVAGLRDALASCDGDYGIRPVHLIAAEKTAEGWQTGARLFYRRDNLRPQARPAAPIQQAKDRGPTQPLRKGDSAQ